MKCQLLFSGAKRKDIINLSSAELAKRVVKISTLETISEASRSYIFFFFFFFLNLILFFGHVAKYINKFNKLSVVLKHVIKVSSFTSRIF